VLRSLAAPPAGPGDDPDAFQEHVASAASGILSLVGVEADPLSSREHILLVKLIEAAWTEARDLDLPELIRNVQKPPFERVGVFDLESFFPAKDRLALAMRLNHLLASPGFSAWTEGEPLEIERLLYTPEGKPRLSVLSIAHLDDHERMFFVTWLLGEVVAWMRRQSGTQSLRALLYLDEVMGFLPPVAEPPSKAPLLTLMKQARAFGVGVVLATQNPIDLDYKALSNAGTWFLGRLQTERDQARLLDGLEGSAAARGGGFERAEMERQLAGMGKRVFLLHSVHQKHPVLFHTRWALSYLRGPLTLQEIARLQPETPVVAPVPVAAPRDVPAPPKPVEARPALPAGLVERFLSVDGAPSEGAQLLYRPALLGSAQLHYADKRMGIDHYVDVTVLAEPEQKAGFDDALEVDTTSWGLASEPGAGARFAKLPSGLGKGSPARLERALRAHLQRVRPLTLARCKPLRLAHACTLQAAAASRRAWGDGGGLSHPRAGCAARAPRRQAREAGEEMGAAPRSRGTAHQQQGPGGRAPTLPAQRCRHEHRDLGRGHGARRALRPQGRCRDGGPCRDRGAQCLPYGPRAGRRESR
jgi:hypothetical protein